MGFSLRISVVVPFLDFAQVNLGKRRPVKNQCIHIRQVICRDDSAHRQWHMNDVAAGFFRLGNLFIVHRAIGAAEVNGLCRHLLNAAARPNRLVIHFDVLRLVILIRPRTHHGKNKTTNQRR